MSRNTVIARTDDEEGIGQIRSSVKFSNTLKPNLGPIGTQKMFIGKDGEVSLTKIGRSVLKLMKSSNYLSDPTASFISESVLSECDMFDGTISVVLLVGEILSLSQPLLLNNLYGVNHVSNIIEGIQIAERESQRYLDFLSKQAMKNETNDLRKKNFVRRVDESILLQLAKTELRTKLDSEKLVNEIAEIAVESIQIIQEKVEEKEEEEEEGERSDESRIYIDTIKRIQIISEEENDSLNDVSVKLVRGVVLDHGARHPKMSRNMKNVFILVMNISLEEDYFGTGFPCFYDFSFERGMKRAEERINFLEKKVNSIINLKNEMDSRYENSSFFVVNGRGINPKCLSMLAENGITAVRRSSRRSMKRIILACGGEIVHSLKSLENPKVLGWSERVYEVSWGKNEEENHIFSSSCEKYTFIDVGSRKTVLGHDVRSCTIAFSKLKLDTSIKKVKEATKKCLRVLKKSLELKNNRFVVPGAGSFEMFMSDYLLNFLRNNIEVGDVELFKAKQGIEVFRDALLVIPRSLAENSGFNGLECIRQLSNNGKNESGLDLFSGEEGRLIDPIEHGIWDSFAVKKYVLRKATEIATQLLRVDGIMYMKKKEKERVGENE